jgi:CDP-6-deoxy-D-xylo-4-hexulose-3-dehydrase
MYNLASSTWDLEEPSAIQEVVRSGKLTMGIEVRNFELEFAKFFGSSYAIMVNSGSSANLLAVTALMYKANKPLTPGMEVIVPTISWSTTYYPVFQNGLVLKFVDVSIDDLNIDIKKVKESINSNTGAIFAVNLLGNPSSLADLRKIADEHNIYLIEDNCESMGAQVEGKYAGTWGDLGTFSFYFSHHINTIEGGMVLTNDEELRDILVSLRAHGWTRELSDENFVHKKTGNQWEDLFNFVLPGYNLRPTEIQGVLGSVQLKKFPKFLLARAENQDYFLSKFANVPGIKLQEVNGTSSSFGFSIVLTEESGITRSAVIAELSKNRIESRPIVAGNFLRNPVISRMKVIADAFNPAADLVHSNGFFLGNHHYGLVHEIDQAYEVMMKVMG